MLSSCFFFLHENQILENITLQVGNYLCLAFKTDVSSQPSENCLFVSNIKMTNFNNKVSKVDFEDDI